MSALPGKKAFLAIGCGIAFSLAILAFSNRVTTPNRDNPHFRYGTDEDPNIPVHVIDNNRMEIPFAFDIDGAIPEISLAFSGDHDRMPGLSLRDKRARVVNGKAGSAIIIHFYEKPALKAGTHFLTVDAKDPFTGRIIRQGKIPFTYNMHEVIGKCSC